MKSFKDFKKQSYDLIYVDAMNLSARSFHGMSNLSFKGKNTGLAYGSVRFFLDYRSKHPDADIVFLWEGKGSWRKKEYPFYKANRVHSSDDGFFDAVNFLKSDILPNTGIEQHSHDELEADDLAFYYCQVHKIAGKQVLLVSTDQDWWYLSRSNVQILDKNNLLDKSDVESMLGFEGKKIHLFKCIKGDTSDNISGIPRFPTALAVRLAKDCETIEELHQKLLEYGQQKWAEKVDDFRWVLERNKILVSPQYGRIKNIEVVGSSYNSEELNKALMKLGMESLSKSIKEKLG